MKFVILSAALAELLVEKQNVPLGGSELRVASHREASGEILVFTSLREAPPKLRTLRERCANRRTNHTLIQQRRTKKRILRVLTQGMLQIVKEDLCVQY